MAGLVTTMTRESLSGGYWYQCADGWPLEPLDTIHLLFPNKGRDTIRENVCFVPEHFTFSPLRNVLPNKTKLFLPDDFVDSCVALFYMCIYVTLGMIAVKYIWEKADPKFANITPNHKKWYVVANMFKAFFLACMMSSTRYWIGTYHGLIQDRFSGIEVKRTGILYIATDVVALYMVPKLPRSTVLHHVSTAVLIMIVSTLDMTVKGWSGLLGTSKMALLYGIMSSVSFCVNAYLALRVVYPKARWLPVLAHFSLWPYILLCAVNWSVHAVWLIRLVVTLDISIAPVLYLFAIANMINDDIVLIRWLWKRSSPMAEHEEKSIRNGQVYVGKKEE